MNDAPTKRPWFQFHLSTAIIVMFAAAGLLWLNLNLMTGWTKAGPHYGFPLPFWTRWFAGWVQDRLNGEGKPVIHTEIWWGQLCVNLLLNAMVLIAIGWFCEWLIRRKAAKAATQPPPPT